MRQQRGRRFVADTLRNEPAAEDADQVGAMLCGLFVHGAWEDRGGGDGESISEILGWG